MKLSVRRFIISFFVTLMIIISATGIYKITAAGEKMTGAQSAEAEIDYDLIIRSGEAADSAIGIFCPEIRTAAHWFLIVCAAVSEWI